MTAREIFEGMLIELSKVKAPSLLLQDFNYLMNKTIRLFTDRLYDLYDNSQKVSDNLRVLKSTAILDPVITTAYNDMSVTGTSQLSSLYPGLANLYGKTYEVILPDDYLHMLNCICVFKVKKNFKCYNAGSYVQFNATRLDSDKWGLVINDYYNRPEPTRPYYFIHNVNTNQNNELTNPYNNGKGTDLLIIESQDTDVANKTVEFPRTKTINLLQNTSYEMPLYDTPAGSRHNNPSAVRCELRFGKDDSIFELVKVSIDYLKAPLKIRLTPEQMDLTEDTSQIMEWPDHVCQLIINELVMHVMENTGDPRLQTNMAVNLTTAPSPTQMQLQQTAGQSA